MSLDPILAFILTLLVLAGGVGFTIWKAKIEQRQVVGRRQR